MATQQDQKPLYDINPATFKWIYVFRNDAIVSGVPTPYWNVSFYSAVFMNPVFGSLGSANSLIAEAKTIPNNTGAGIFNFQKYAESYTAPQYLAYTSASRPVTLQGTAATYQGIYFPIHVIDKFSQNDKNASYIEARCQMEGSAQPNLPATVISGTIAPSVEQMVFNGYLQNDFALTRIGWDFGYDYETEYAPLNQFSYGILSDTPQVGIGGTTMQYAGPHDYGVFSFFNAIFTNFTKPTGVEIMGYFSDGSTDSFIVDNIDANGGTTTFTPGVPNCFESILYFGVFPGNLRQTHVKFENWIVDKDRSLECYTFRLVNEDGDGGDGGDPRDEDDNSGGEEEAGSGESRSRKKRDEEQPICEMCEDYKWDTRKEGEECRYDTRTACERANYRCEECEEPGTWRWGPEGECVYLSESACEDAHDEPAGGVEYLSVPHWICLRCPSSKGYEPVRIAWLNSMGGWDYYTFNMKSKKEIKTKRNDWTQLEGSWNDVSWNPQGWKGGKKAFTVNAKSTIIVNTDLVSEAEADWFTKLINSPEIYIIHPHYQFKNPSQINSTYEQYVKSVRLMTSSFKVKTRVNDNVIQYTFKFEESRTLNTQPI
jgi:hypothetical protein